MPTIEEPIIVPLEADFEGFNAALDELEKSSKRFGSAFSSSIRTAIRSGAGFEDTLKSLALRLSDIGLQAGLRPLENAVSGLFESTLGTLVSSATGPQAQSFNISSLIQPFLARGANAVPNSLVGAKVSEARMNPLARQAVPSNVTVNISTPDIESFRKSQTQISTVLARTVSRSQRGS